MPDTKTNLHESVAATLKRLEAKDKGLKQQISKAYGHAVFPSVGKAALVVGGSFGRGLVFEKGKFIGYATITQLTLGVQIGGDTFSEVVIFESRQALDRFKQNKMAFAANASAVLVKAAASGTADFPKGVQALAYSRGGMLLEAAIGAQKFKFKPAGEEGEQEDDEQQDAQSGGKSKGKASSGGQKQQSGGDSSGEQEEGDDEGEGDDSSGLLSRAGNLMREHPILATVAGVGIAGVAMLVMRKLRSTGSEDDQGEQDDSEDQEQGDQAEGNADDQSDDDSQDDQDQGDDDRGEDDEGGNERGGTRGGDMLGFLRRRRSRA